MPDFKQQVERDIRSVFLNLKEFGETHEIEGANVIIVPDSDLLVERKSGLDASVADSTFLFHVAERDFPQGKTNGNYIRIDGAEYVIDSVQKNIGMLTVAVSRHTHN